MNYKRGATYTDFLERCRKMATARDEPFNLKNDPPPPKRPDNVPAKQLKLLDGLDCCKGQQDLFE